MTSPVAVAVVVVATIVAADPAVSTLLLLDAAVDVVVKARIMQTARTASSRAARR